MPVDFVKPDWRPFLYGGLASIAAEFTTFPIDTTKTRLQIQGQKVDRRHMEIKYKGMLHALSRISREEGVKALYSGIGPAVLRQATYGTIKIGIYYSCKRKLVRHPSEERLTTNVMCGAVAGVVSSSIANPTDVLKVRMQAEGFRYAGRPMLRCFGDIYHQEGIRGLWRGVGPTAQRAAIVVGVELPVYDFAKRRFVRLGVSSDSYWNHFMSSFLAGFAGAVASNPIDVIRTRLMNDKRLAATQAIGPVLEGPKLGVGYTSSFDCLVQTVKSEGMLALYKGFIPTWVRLGPWNIIFFMTYEHLNKVY